MARARNAEHHDCVCPQQPRCVLHGAEEFGGGEPDACQPHGHDQAFVIDAERLARAMTGVVFMDIAPNRRVAATIAAEYARLANPDTGS